ncbi:PIR Superfamily Protein [Plasmodium ovale curtisi]|uniref:PIR Superfamily Protein n=2 Tax=Plasmodium ovale curtisi TaxID=864141 RepID=A0A1A8WCR6_PLAOA|nr:PIR Superfamily Protein [Plasmodium ovale curtisi]
METQDELLSNLNSYIFYGRLDNLKELPIYTEADFWSFIKNGLYNHQEDRDMSSISDTLLKGFNYVSTMPRDATFYDERWNFLYFWMGEKVLNILKNTSEFSTIMHTAKLIRNKFDTSYTINDNIYEITAEEFPKLKKIYDYVQNYVTIKNKFTELDFKCTEDFSKHIQERYDAYNNLKSNCVEGDISCKAFNVIVKSETKENLSKIECKHFKHASVVPARPPRMELDESSRFQIIPRENGHQFPEHGQTLTEDSHSSSSIFIGIALPFLGFIFILFFLYKFTPFRSLLHTRLKEKIKIGNNVREEIEETHGLLDDTYEHINTEHDMNTHHLSYYPL